MSPLDAVVRDVLGAELDGAVRGAFKKMEWAEEEIAAAEKRWPRARRRLHASFMTLCPTGYTLGSEEVYRRHCRELLVRVKSGQDVGPGTDAEVACVLMQASLAAPPDADHAAAYGVVFARLFPEHAEIVGDLRREYITGRADEIIAELRKKIGREVNRAKPEPK